MKIINNTIIFKSMEPFYSKEQDGRKSNTVRTLDSIDEIKQFIDFHARYEERAQQSSGYEYTYSIIIEKTPANDTLDFFVRSITDISQLCTPRSWTYVISW